MQLVGQMFYIGACHLSTCLCNEKGRNPSFSEQKCQWPERNVLDLNCGGDVHTLPSVVCDLSLEHKQSLYCTDFTLGIFSYLCPQTLQMMTL